MSETEEERLERMVTEKVESILGVGPGAGAPPPFPGIPGYGGGQVLSERELLEEALADIDPTDSESAILLFDWLKKNGRLHKIGVLDGISTPGYIFMYQEPKGSTKEGWTEGGTQGDRMVDSALDRAKASEGAPAQRGLCPKCYSAVKAEAGKDPVLENAPEGTDPAVCKDGGTHELFR